MSLSVACSRFTDEDVVPSIPLYVPGPGSGEREREREEELDDYYYTWVGHFTLLVTTNKALPN